MQTVSNPTPNFNCSPADHRLIEAITRRAFQLATATDPSSTLLPEEGFDRLSLSMDLAACHNSSPLDLPALLAASDGNFIHDVFGIMRHLDRKTGTLQDCFLPRFTA